jgi:hypothetical protein
MTTNLGAFLLESELMDRVAQVIFWFELLFILLFNMLAAGISCHVA